MPLDIASALRAENAGEDSQGARLLAALLLFALKQMGSNQGPAMTEEGELRVAPRVLPSP
jgi:hypothetical protein